jgi:hypothetical protein
MDDGWDELIESVDGGWAEDWDAEFASRPFNPERLSEIEEDWYWDVEGLKLERDRNRARRDGSRS